MKVREAQWIKDQCCTLLSRLDYHAELLGRLPDFDVRDRIRDKIRLADTALLFGLNMPEGEPWSTYIKLSEHAAVVLWTDRMDISRPDKNCGSPEMGERLYVVSFPCGPYHLSGAGIGESYPRESFGRFFDQLKAFGPKYSDTANGKLYFGPGKAQQVHNLFQGMMEKARQWAVEELKQERKAQLEAELERLSREEE